MGENATELQAWKICPSPGDCCHYGDERLRIERVGPDPQCNDATEFCPDSAHTPEPTKSGS